MIAIAEALSAGIDLMRVDLYDADGRMVVGEMTATPGCEITLSSKSADARRGR